MCDSLATQISTKRKAPKSRAAAANLPQKNLETETLSRCFELHKPTFDAFGVMLCPGGILAQTRDDHRKAVRNS